MTPRRTSIAAALALPFLVLLSSMLAGCAASTPSDIGKAKFYRIAYYDFRTNVVSVLGDKDDPEFRDIYSKKQKSANVKVTDREHLLAVIDELSAANYFEHAGNLDRPEQVTDTRPYKFFVVHADGRPYSLYLAKGVAAANKDIAISMSKAAEIISRASNEVPQLQWLDTHGQGSEYYEQEQERLRQQNAAKQKGGDGGGR